MPWIENSLILLNELLQLKQLCDNKENNTCWAHNSSYQTTYNSTHQSTYDTTYQSTYDTTHKTTEHSTHFDSNLTNNLNTHYVDN